jgi:hypothetical protein
VKLSDLASIVGPRKQPVMRIGISSRRGRCRNTFGWLRKTVRSPIDAFQRDQAKVSHCDYFGLSQDLASLIHACTEVVRS